MHTLKIIPKKSVISMARAFREVLGVSFYIFYFFCAYVYIPYIPFFIFFINLKIGGKNALIIEKALK